MNGTKRLLSLTAGLSSLLATISAGAHEVEAPAPPEPAPATAAQPSEDDFILLPSEPGDESIHLQHGSHRSHSSHRSHRSSR